VFIEPTPSWSTCAAFGVFGIVLAFGISRDALRPPRSYRYLPQLELSPQVSAFMRFVVVGLIFLTFNLA
jgi:hypothetical protein